MRYLVFGLLSILTVDVYANIFQFFTGISYSNPAELFKVKKNEFIIGSTIPEVGMQFKGSSFNSNTLGYETGVAKMQTTEVMPYGRIAQRFNDRLVFGVDVTEPYNSNVNWGNYSILRYVSTQTYVTDVDVSPRASWSLTKNVYIGGGLNFNFMSNTQLNFALPISATKYGNFVNKLSSFNTGYDLGAYFVVDKSNFIGFSYFSPINMNMTGTSSLEGSNKYSPNLSSPVPLPSTTAFSYTHLFSPTWLSNVQVFYTRWNTFHNIYLNNTGLGTNLVLPQSFHGTFNFVGVLRNQYSEKLGLSLIGLVDTNPSPEIYRAPGLPSDEKYAIAASGEYNLNKTTTLQLLYAHAFYSTVINTFRTFPNGQRASSSKGTMSVNANAVDLRIKFAY